MHQSLLVKSSVLTQRSIDCSSYPGIYNGSGDSSAEMALVEEGEDLVSIFESGDACADGFNCAGSIGRGDNAVFDCKRVFALGEYVSNLF